MANHARVKHVALTHFVPIVFDRERVVLDVRRHFRGGISLGEDLMSFDVSGGQVSLIRSGILGHP